jgi:hypothetical protein
MDAEKLSPVVWGPPLWHTLFTFALAYPLHPNTVTKRKYYDFIQNLPVFLPNSEIRNSFAQLLEEFPIQPYLSSRNSFVQWVHFIHNRLNKKLGKKEITMNEALDKYYSQYRTPVIKVSEKLRISKETIQNGLILSLLFVIFFWDSR